MAMLNKYAVEYINQKQREVWVGDNSGSCQCAIEHCSRYSCSNNPGPGPEGSFCNRKRQHFCL